MHVVFAILLIYLFWNKSFEPSLLEALRPSDALLFLRILIPPPFLFLVILTKFLPEGAPVEELKVQIA